MVCDSFGKWKSDGEGAGAAHFGVENLIFPRPFLLGTSLRADFYWEIGVKPIALKRIKAFVSKMYLFL